MRIALGADHRGVSVKSMIGQMLKSDSYQVVDVGTDSTESVDYPDIAGEVARRVAQGEADRGILICNSGIGMCIAANKVPGVRAALVHDIKSAEMSRQHNDANVLCLSADQYHHQDTPSLLSTWLQTEFEGGRHQRRVSKISDLEQNGPNTAPQPEVPKPEVPGQA